MSGLSVMKKIFEIQRLTDGEFKCCVRDTDETELCNAIAGLCVCEEGEVLFDVIVDALAALMSDWSDKEIDYFTDGLNESAKKLKEQLEAIESKRLSIN